MPKRKQTITVGFTHDGRASMSRNVWTESSANPQVMWSMPRPKIIQLPLRSINRYLTSSLILPSASLLHGWKRDKQAREEQHSPVLGYMALHGKKDNKSGKHRSGEHKDNKPEGVNVDVETKVGHMFLR